MFINQKSLMKILCILRISDEHRRDFYWRNPQPYAVSKGELTSRLSYLLHFLSSIRISCRRTLVKDRAGIRMDKKWIEDDMPDGSSPFMKTQR